jgi:ABC-type glycerol-3-phosphate transport system substrate-binding protein
MKSADWKKICRGARLLGLAFGAATVACHSVWAADDVAPWAASGQIPQTTITICYFGSPTLEELQRAGPAFTNYTKGRVKVDYVSIPTAQILPGTLSLLRGGDTCDISDENPIYSYAVRPYLQPLNGFMQDANLFNAPVYDLNDFPKSVLNILSDSSGNLYGLPISTDATVVMYRKDLFGKWGISAPELPNAWTWNQFIDVLKQLKAKLASEGPAGMSAVVFPGNNVNSGPAYATMGMWSAGGELFDGTAPKFEDPIVAKGFNYWTSMGKAGIDAAAPEVTSSDFNEVLTSFQQQHAAIAIEWQAAAGVLEDKTQSPATAGKIGYTLLPYGGSDPAQLRQFASVHSLSITKNAKHPKEAFEFAVWFTSKEVAAGYAGRGGANSGRSSLLNDPALIAIRPEFPALAQATKLYHPLPLKFSYFDFMNQVVGPNSNSVFAGSMTADAALAKMQSDAMAYMKKAGH